MSKCVALCRKDCLMIDLEYIFYSKPQLIARVDFK